MEIIKREKFEIINNKWIRIFKNTSLHTQSGCFRISAIYAINSFPDYATRGPNNQNLLAISLTILSDKQFVINYGNLNTDEFKQDLDLLENILFNS